MSWKTVGLGALALLWLTPAPGAGQVEYPVKFVCGQRTLAAVKDTFATVVPGYYLTAVNIHNPRPENIRFLVRIATALPPPGGVVTPVRPFTLTGDQAMELDCSYVRRILERQRGAFVKGFLMIFSKVELDVVAVYTAGPLGPVQTMDVERVASRPTTMRF